MFKRTILMSAGVVIFLIGAILFPMPVPIGLPIMVLGLSIILKTSHQVKRLTVRLIHKNRHSSGLWCKMREIHKRIRNKKTTP